MDEEKDDEEFDDDLEQPNETKITSFSNVSNASGGFNIEEDEQDIEPKNKLGVKHVSSNNKQDSDNSDRSESDSEHSDEIDRDVNKKSMARQSLQGFNDNLEDEEGYDSEEYGESDESDEEWTLHDDSYNDDYEKEESDEGDNNLDILFEKKTFGVESEIDLKAEDTMKFIEEFGSMEVIITKKTLLTSQEEFYQNYMNIPETPAREALSLVAATHKDHLSTADPIKHYFQDISTNDYVSKTEPRAHVCPSIESFFKLNRMTEVFFYLYPGSKMISKDCRLDTTIFAIKAAIGRYVKVPPSHLDLRKKKNLVADDKTLAELYGKPGKKMKFTVEINRRLSGNFEISLPKDRVVKNKEDTRRRLRIETADGGSYFVNLRIVHPVDLKPMLGGFVDQRARKTYHDAYTTMVKTPRPFRSTQINAGCQAFATKVSGIQTLLDKGQQMERKGVYITDTTDKIIQAQPNYLPHEHYELNRKNAAILIQRYWRRWLAIRERHRREEGLIQRVRWAENIRKGRLEQRRAIMNQELERQENPKRLVDMELLYRAINCWRKEEEQFVNENRWGAERKAALATLADLESDLLLDLERTKNRINVEEKENRTLKVFDKMGTPKRWLSAKTANFITLDDREKVKVRQLQSIYKQLLAPVKKTIVGKQNRSVLLGQLNLMTNSVNSKMAQMLTELVSRELTFLQMPVCSDALLAGVRRRIATTFFFLCQDPLFNKEATKVSKVPFDKVKLRKDMIQCKGCRRMQYRDEFTIVKGTTVTSRCHTCMNLYRTAILRVDLNLYRHMLKELRRDELAATVVNSVTFLIDAFDLQFLVEQIWHGQSALSGIDNRYLLRLCRWKKDRPWAPWNCVLLTEEEATAHLQLENMQDAYKQSFFHKVLVKQCTAKAYFEGIAKLTIGLDARIEENCKNEQQLKSRTNQIKNTIRKRAKFMNLLRK